MATDAMPAAEMPPAYDPARVEEARYAWWEERGYFQPRMVEGRDPFVVIMPPPNVTGQLHLGHALTATVEDTLVRWRRMQGRPTLWLPGTDHAGIATQYVVENYLASQGIDRRQIGREQFLEHVWEWVRAVRREPSRINIVALAPHATGLESASRSMKDLPAPSALPLSISMNPAGSTAASA